MNKIVKVIILIIVTTLVIMAVSFFSTMKPLSSSTLDFYLILLSVLSILVYSINQIKPKYPILVTQLSLIIITYAVLKIIGMQDKISNRYVFILYSILLASSYHFIDYNFFIKQKLPYFRAFLFSLAGGGFFTIIQIIIHLLIKLPVSSNIVMSYFTNFLFFFIFIALSKIIHSSIIHFAEQKLL